MTTITNKAGTEIDFDAAVALMDDGLRESLNAVLNKGEPGLERPDDIAEQHYFDAYCAAHWFWFHEEFEPNKANPVW